MDSTYEYGVPGDEISNKLAALIDWQNVHLGSPVEDLVRFLTSSSDPQIRRNYWKQVLAHYFASLQCHLSDEEVESYGISLESLQKLFQDQLSYAAACGTTQCAVVLNAELFNQNKAVQKHILRRLKCAIDDML